MWWQVLLLLVFVSILCFSLVLFSGAPYLPTLTKQVKAALELANLKPGMTLIELGSGDGRVILAAAKTGLKVVAYELNPILFLISWLRTRRYRNQVTLIYGNFWRKTWPKADCVYVFLLPRLMTKLETKIVSENQRRVISFAFSFPNNKVVAEKNGVMLYDFKA